MWEMPAPTTNEDHRPTQHRTRTPRKGMLMQLTKKRQRNHFYKKLAELIYKELLEPLGL
jgi:hypothetical protein